MPTVKEVIHQLGYPPAEICDDWMLQLTEFATGYDRLDCPESVDHADSVLTIQSASPQIDQPHAAWSLIEIDAHGVLSPHKSKLSSRILTKGELLKLTVQLAQWTQSRDWLPNAIAGRPQSKRIAKQVRRPTAIRYSIAIVVMLAALWLSSNWFLSGDQANVRQHTSTAMAASASAEQAPRLARNSAMSSLQESAENGSLNPAEDYSLQTLNPLPSHEPPPESLLDQSIRVEPLIQMARSGNPATSSPSVAPSAIANNSPSAQQSPFESSVESSNPTARIGQSAEEPMIDVLGELATMVQSTMTQSEEVEPMEQEVRQLASSETGNPETVVDTAPLTLSLSPAIQVQTFDKSVRPRLPMWKLRLSVSEEFTIEPFEAQVLEDRGWASWVLREAKKPSSSRWPKRDNQLNSQNPTQVLVQVQLANHRQTSLRWRIVAGANDFPSLAVPLDPSWLDRAQIGLRTQAQWLLEESERTQALGRADGLPSATRSALTARRRALEAQHKLATRWLEIVADANQFPAWLDGQLNVHAQLHDAAQAAAQNDTADAAQVPSPPLLQFGTL